MNVRHVFLILFSACMLITAPPAVSGQQDTSSEADEQKPFLGVRVGPLSERLRSINDITVKSGVVVKHVVPDTPAERAGLKSFDVIQAVDGTSVSSVSELRQQIGARSPGDRISLTVHRSGENRTVRTRLRSYNRTEGGKHTTNTSDERDTQKMKEMNKKEMKELIKEMGEMEKSQRSGSGESDRSARTPQELRKKMKSFLEANGTESTGNKNGKEEQKTASSDEGSGEFERLYKKLKESLPDDVAERLNPEQLRELTEQTRKWVRDTSAEDVKKTMTKLLDELKKRVKSLNGENVQEVKKWKESLTREMEKQMKTFEQQMDEKFNQFENKLDEQMKQYNQKLQEKIDQLKELKKEQQDDEDVSDDDDGSSESSNPEPYLGIRPSRAPSGNGIVIRKVKEGSPAHKAGLQKGDIIRKMNGSSLKNVRALQKRFYQFSPGEEVTFFVERDGWTKKMTIKVGRRSDSSDDQSSDNSQSKDKSDSSSFNKKKFFQSNVLEEGKRAYWMLEMMTDYKHGRYLRFLKNGLSRSVQLLKQNLKEQPLQIDGRIRVFDRETGKVLLSVPLRGDLTEAVNRLHRLVRPVLEPNTMEPSDPQNAESSDAPGMNQTRGDSAL
jgi:C-terminal processing protease CtpA/Prc